MGEAGCQTLVADNRALRHEMTDDPHHRLIGQRIVAARRIRAAERRKGGGLAAPDCTRDGFKRSRAIFVRLGQHQRRAARGCQLAGETGIGEEGHRRLRANEDQRIRSAQERDGRHWPIGQAFHDHAPGAPFDPRREGVADEPRAGCGGNPASSLEATATQSLAAQQEGDLAATQGRDGLHDGLVAHLRRAHHRERG